MLQPDLPPGGVARDALFIPKFGSVERMQSIFDHVTQVAAEDGITMRFDLMTKAPNTRLAHRIVAITDETPEQNAVVEALFSAYFEHGVDITSVDALLPHVAGRVPSLDVVALSAGLAAGDGDQDVQTDLAAAAQYRVSGVPLFIGSNGYALQGAQPKETFASFLTVKADG